MTLTSLKIINIGGTNRVRHSFSTFDQPEWNVSWRRLFVVRFSRLSGRRREGGRKFLANNSCRVTCSNSRVSLRRYKIASCLGRGQVRPVYTSLRHRGRASSGVRYYHRKVTGSVTNVLGNFHAPFPPNRFYRFRVVMVVVVLARSS